jgi:hypothetical protein
VLQVSWILTDPLFHHAGGSISANNFDASDIKASLESIRSDHADSKGMDCSESKGGAKGDVIDAAKVRIWECGKNPAH